MQLKRTKKMGSLSAVILLTGGLLLTTVGSVMAENPQIQLDFSNINPTVKTGTASGGTVAQGPGVSTGQMPTAASAANSIPTNFAAAGTGDQEINQVMGDIMSGAGSDIMAEMQKKVMAENMGSIQKAIQASVMESMRGAMQQPAGDSTAK